MRLVLHFVSGDGFTYSCDVSLPFEYESAEAAIVDFEREATDVYLNQKVSFTFAGHNLNVNDFFARNPDEDWRAAKLYLPSIWTIDEWFQHESRSC